MKFTLVTGANGEIGHSLLAAFAADADRSVVAVDLSPFDPAVAASCHETIVGDVADPSLWARLETYDFVEIYHLAALLSTSAEKAPMTAHHVNVNGTLGLLSMARSIGMRTGIAVKFLFPSTIAVYGLPTLDEKNAAAPVTELEFLQPTTMYGINKLYCESVGAYMSDRFGQLLEAQSQPVLDFRALRFPGLISAFTIPSGGTSDYAPEMIHAAAKGEAYACFVRPDAKIPFMAMPDGVRALMELAAAPSASLTQRVYNIGAFAPTALDIEAEVRKSYSDAAITYLPHAKRQAIIDSWCADVNDSAARADWGWKPEYDLERAFREYLIPNIAGVYA